MEIKIEGNGNTVNVFTTPEKNKSTFLDFAVKAGKFIWNLFKIVVFIYTCLNSTWQ